MFKEDNDEKVWSLLEMSFAINYSMAYFTVFSMQSQYPVVL